MQPLKSQTRVIRPSAAPRWLRSVPALPLLLLLVQSLPLLLRRTLHFLDAPLEGAAVRGAEDTQTLRTTSQ